MKTIIWIVVIIIIAVIGWSFIGGQPTTPPGPENAALPAEQGQAMPAQNGAEANTNDISSPSDSSDAALAKDAATIDAQMNSLDKDSASADQSLNDKPITQ